MVLSCLFDNLPGTQMFFDIHTDNLCDPLEKIPQRKKPIPTVIKIKAITRQHWFLVLTPTYMDSTLKEEEARFLLFFTDMR